MRCSLAAALLVLGSSGTVFGVEKWPDPAIPVPHPVAAFILAECQDYAGTTDEDLHACITGERHGYRATVMMLSDPATGEVAAERYVACRAGLGMHGGRFHRRRAECIGSYFKHHWRFTNTQRAAIPHDDSRFSTAAIDGVR